MRFRLPRLSQYCTAIFSATSTATEPESLKNTRSRSPGASSADQPLRQRQRRLVHQAAEHDVRHRRELALDRCADVRMVVAVAGGPPRGDAVDQFAAVGQHDAAAVRRGDRKRRRRGLHLRIGQPDVIEAVGVPGGEAARFCLFSLVLPDIRRFHATAMRSLDEFACGKLAALERARLRRTPVVTARDGILAERDGRRLLSFSCNDYLNLSQHPADHQGGDRGGTNATASAPAPRASSPAITRSTTSSKAGWRGSKAPRRPACSAPAISPIPASSRRWSAATIWSLVDELSHACIHAGAQAERRQRAALSATTTSAMPRRCSRNIAAITRTR